MVNFSFKIYACGSDLVETAVYSQLPFQKRNSYAIHIYFCLLGFGDGLSIFFHRLFCEHILNDVSVASDQISGDK